ncbi:hypothetical protein [Flavobacterium cerinum]|uniref:DUF4369 domain-containing protein n=1 Tax=Flavobacterium cerinum TaxID=2502784 RepID=A0ABY5IPX1_9FLAO|nr:hypothetical protein [Flavobacterium cerinum]UUC44893.1 hypothetical protein NOX80_14835 [Flavobacterium cerinum]
MIRILIFILLFYVNTIFSQNTLVINFEYCKAKEVTSVYDNEYKIVYNDSIITEYKHSDNYNLPDGKYYITYKTYFDWKRTNSFLLFNKVIYNLDFCIDEVNVKPIENHNLAIDLMKNGESLEIIHNYSGCFNSGKEKIVIERINNKFFLNYNTIRRKLTKREIDFIRTYEIELINLDTYEEYKICMAYSQNIIRYGEHQYDYAESCPKWNGFTQLTEKLKLVKLLKEEQE